MLVYKANKLSTIFSLIFTKTVNLTANLGFTGVKKTMPVVNVLLAHFKINIEIAKNLPKTQSLYFCYLLKCTTSTKILDVRNMPKLKFASKLEKYQKLIKPKLDEAQSVPLLIPVTS